MQHTFWSDFTGKITSKNHFVTKIQQSSNIKTGIASALLMCPMECKSLTKFECQKNKHSSSRKLFEKSNSNSFITFFEKLIFYDLSRLIAIFWKLFPAFLSHFFSVSVFVLASIAVDFEFLFCCLKCWFFLSFHYEIFCNCSRQLVCQFAIYMHCICIVD